MKTYQTKVKKVKAVQWRGWPHKLKFIQPHHVYPQLATLKEGEFANEEIYPNDWIVKHPNGTFCVLRPFEFKVTYQLCNT